MYSTVVFGVSGEQMSGHVMLTGGSGLWTTACFKVSSESTEEHSVIGNETGQSETGTGVKLAQKTHAGVVINFKPLSI